MPRSSASQEQRPITALRGVGEALLKGCQAALRRAKATGKNGIVTAEAADFLV